MPGARRRCDGRPRRRNAFAGRGSGWCGHVIAGGRHRAAPSDPARPGGSDAHRALGLALLRSGRLAEATASFELAIALEEGVAIAHYRLAVALDRGMSRRSHGGLSPGGRADARDGRGHRRLAALLEAEGDVGGSRGVLPPRRRRSRDDQEPARRDQRTAARQRSRHGRRRCCPAAITLDPASDQAAQGPGRCPRRGRAVLTRRVAGLRPRAWRFEPAGGQRASRHGPAKISTEADRPRLDRMLAMLASAGIGDTHRLVPSISPSARCSTIWRNTGRRWRFDQADAIRRRTTRFGEPALAEHVDRRRRAATRGFLAGRRGVWRARRDAAVAIVGMPRSGTTLGRADGVQPSSGRRPRGGELRFWVRPRHAIGDRRSDLLTAGGGARLAAGIFALLCRIGPPAARVTDKAPFDHIRLGLFRLLLPDTRIIRCRPPCRSTLASRCISRFSDEKDERFAWAKADLALLTRRYAGLRDGPLARGATARGGYRGRLRGSDRRPRGRSPPADRLQAVSTGTMPA